MRCWLKSLLVATKAALALSAAIGAYREEFVADHANECCSRRE